MKATRSVGMKPRSYHKVKLKTASGGSLTIRYRRPADLKTVNCSSASGSSSASATAEASITSSDHSLHDACSYFAASMNDQHQAFDDLADLPEYSQIRSCISEVPNSDASDALHNYDIQPAGFTSSLLWSPDHECNSSDIGSNEVLPELPEDNCFDILNTDLVTVNESCLALMSNEALPELPEGSCFDISTTDLVPVNESRLLEPDNSTSWSSLREMQHFSLQHNSKPCQEIKLNADGIGEANSTLLCMGAYEELGTSFWSTSAGESSVAEENLIALQSSHMSFLCFPSVLTSDIMESSEDVELIGLPPLLHYAETGGLQDSTLQQFESIMYGNSLIELNTSQEDAELFDESNFLMLDPGMPDEVNLENSGMLQGPWGVFFEHATKYSEAAAVPDSTSAHVKEVATQWPSINLTSSCKDESNRLDPSLGPAESAGQGSEGVGPRGKNCRRKRLRRATPLHTFKSLLSSKENVSGCEVGHAVDRTSPAFDKLHVFARKPSGRGKAKVCLSGAEEKSRTTWHAPAFRSIDEIQNSDRQACKKRQNPSCCTSSEELENMQVNSNRQLSYVSSQRRSRMRSTLDQSRRRRPDAARRAPRYTSLLPERAVSTLRKWFDEHISFPFADKEQKLDLVSQTGLTLTQVDNWLSNYRHRLKVRKSDYEGNVLRPEKTWTRQ